MHDIIPKREVIETRHKIYVEFSLREILRGIGQYSESKHVGEHKAHYCRGEHENAAKSRRRLPDGKKHKHQSAHDKACLKLERIGERPAKIAKSKTLAKCRM